MTDYFRQDLGKTGAAAPGAGLPTVLVIDDEPAVRQSLEVLLGAYGFQVALARNGAQGLAAFRRIQPDLVLTDIIMPIQDGIETILILRRERPDARIIAISGGGPVGESDYVTMATKLGADAAIAKPFESGELMDTVRSLLGGEHRTVEQACAA
jgi:two-component system chemotaxis response regulator CheY